MVDFEDLAVVEAGGAHGGDVGFGDGGGVAGEFDGVLQGGLFAGGEGVGEGFLVEGGADGLGAGVVGEQALEAGEVVVDAVGAAVEAADEDAEGFEEPLWNGVGGVVDGVLVDRHVGVHRVGPQAVGHHDVVDVVAGAFDAVVEQFEAAGCFGVGDGGDPGHGAGFSDWG